MSDAKDGSSAPAMESDSMHQAKSVRRGRHMGERGISKRAGRSVLPARRLSTWRCLRAHAFLEGAGRRGPGEIVAHVGDAVRAREIEILVGALGFHHQRG